MRNEIENKHAAKEGSTVFAILAIFTFLCFAAAITLQVIEYLHYNP